ncbi:MAG: transposase [bacterium]|nr:transposase [bacterium]
MQHKNEFITDQIYHIYSRGVRKSLIYMNNADYQRWEKLLFWCKTYNYPYSLFIREVNRGRKLGRTEEEIMEKYENNSKYKSAPVEILAYVEMPNHFHLVLKQLRDDGISEYIHRLLTSYSKFLNTKYDFKGSVFESNAKSVIVLTDEQLIQLIRYIHLNPLVAELIEKKNLHKYIWSSWPVYIDLKDNKLLNMEFIKHNFNTIGSLKEFTQ